MNGSGGRRKFLFFALAVLPGIPAFFSLAGLLAGEDPLPRKAGLFRKIRFKVENGRPSVKEDDFLTIQADRFCGASSPWNPRPGKVRVGYQAVYLLRGTAIHSDPSRSRAFIEVPGVEEQRAYKVGEDVHGAVLEEIHPDSVILKRGTETIQLDLSYEDFLPTGSRSRRGNVPAAGGGEGELPGSGDLVRKLLQGMDPGRRKKILGLPPAQRLRILRNLLRKARQGKGVRGGWNGAKNGGRTKGKKARKERRPGRKGRGGGA